MTDYTPTTEEVREAYATYRFYAYAKYREVGLPEFDRWLAAHDAEVSRQVAGEIAEEIWNEEQRLVLAVSVDPTNLGRNSFMLGLQRARDIAASRGVAEAIAAARGDGAA